MLYQLIVCLIIILCSPIVAAQFVVTERQSEGSEKPAGAGFVVTERPSSVPAEQSRDTIAPPYNRCHAIVFGATWCGPCRTMEDTVIPDLREHGHHVTKIDIDQNPKHPQWVSGGVPFVVILKPDGTVVEQHRGFLSSYHLGNKLNAATRALGVIQPQSRLVSNVATKADWYDGQIGSSHRSRETLIQHLHTGDIHAGKHSMASLNAMTDEQLNALHDSDHGNSNSGAVRSAVPAKSQPVKTRSNSRKFLFFRW